MMKNDSGMDFCFFLSSLSIGGAERVTVNLANALARDGYSVQIIVCRSGGDLRYSISDAVQLVDLNVARTVLALPGLIAQVRRARPIMVLSVLEHTSIVLFVAIKISLYHSKIACIQHSRLNRKERTKGIKNKIQRALIKWTYRRIDQLIAVSSSIADEISEELKVRDDRIRMIYNPVITDKLFAMADQTSDDEFLLVPTPFIIGVGRLSEVKDFGLLVKSFAIVAHRFPSIRLLILGDGPQRSRIERIIIGLGLQDRVSMPGSTQNPYVYMKRASCLVLTSLWEVLPTVLIEALALGTPVVTTDCGPGVSEILGSEAASCVINARDPQLLADAMQRILVSGSVPDVEGLGRFSDRGVARQYEALISR